MPNTIFITGASSGIGKATARYFQARGWNVAATMRNPAQDTDLGALERVLVTRLDVQDAESIGAAVGAATQRFGRIDVLLNNAGYGAYGPLEATPLARLRNQFDVNVLGLLATTQAVLPVFRAQHSGLVVNVSSIGGRLAFPLGAPYHGTKFAVEGISEALQFELGAIGAQVKVVEPGAIRTDFAGRSFDFNNDPALADYQPMVQAVFAALGPMMEMASPPEVVAEVIYAAATDGTGQFRYEAGADAVQLLANRRAVEHGAFYAALKAQFGLDA